jgi:hypothetical protein
MGCSPHHPAAWQDGQVARGRAGPSRQVVPVLVGSDTPDEFPAGSENPPALAVGSVKPTGALARRTPRRGAGGGKAWVA